MPDRLRPPPLAGRRSARHACCGRIHGCHRQSADTNLETASLAYPIRGGFCGAKPIDSISAQDLLVVPKKGETQGLLETARRTNQRCGQVFRQ
ncbi:MAG: phage integrase central domain-containing protein [Steroidobacteraceae bacterium]